MRVLVCGGREFTDRALLEATLDRLHRQHGFNVLLEGDALGADRLAGAWAEARGLDHLVFRADWVAFGAKAGPRRNRRMLEEGRPDLVIAFPGRSGTAHMMRIARAAGVAVIDLRNEH